MRKILSSFLLAFTATALYAQSPLCDGSRFATPVFSDVTKTASVTYGANTTYTGQNQTLLLDIYEPTGDIAAERPLVVLAHGGSFIGGTRNDGDIVNFCNDLAKHGYVAVSIEYRLGLNFTSVDSIEMTKAVLRAVHDMRAAVRFMKKEAATYRIDTSNVYVGGSSAGALTALHHAYLDRLSKCPPYMLTIVNNLGGIEGNSGNPGYSSKAKGVVNIAGCLSEKEFILPDDEPLVSIHGTNDGTVPYGTDVIKVSGLFPIKVVDGSGSIHPYALSQGIESTLKPFNGQDHVPHVSSQVYYDTTFWYMRDFLYHHTCNTLIGVTPAEKSFFQAYPNPVENVLRINLQAPTAMLRIMDLQGSVIFEKTVYAGNNEINTANWAKGMYMIYMQTDKQFYTELLVK